MDSVIDKDQRLSEGHVEAEDRKLDFEELSDDEEVALHLPRKGADERDPQGLEIRDVPGPPVTQREDWFNMEPLHGARPRGLEAEATGVIDDLDTEERGAPAPQLPPPRRDMQGAGVVTPPRKDVDGHGGLRAPGTRLPQRGTRVAPQICTEAREKDVGSDRRNVQGSPENIFIDTMARLQRDLADIRAESRQFRTAGVPPVVPTPRQAAFTTTKVPRFAGTPSWEQQVLDAIVLSNGWDDATAALQLLSHLEGDALNVALLVPVPRQTSRMGLVDA